MPIATSQILKPYEEGKSCIVLQGRSLYDLELNQDGQIQPLIEILKTEAFRKHNLVTIKYSRSLGITYDLTELNDEEKHQANAVLNNLNIRQIAGQQQRDGLSDGTGRFRPTMYDSHDNRHEGDTDEFVSVLRALLKLGMESNGAKVLRNGKPLRFLILIEYPEHLLPHLNNGTHTLEQTIAIELAYNLSTSLGFRKSDNYTILAESRSGLLDSLIYQHIETVHLPQPATAEKRDFLNALTSYYPQAVPADNLTEEIVANLSNGIPNRSLESIVRSSQRTGQAYTEYDLVSIKQKDIVALSEGTLELIDNSRVMLTNLAGVTIRKPFEILMKVVSCLQKGNASIPRNICLCGAPSTGKTVLALIAAAQAGVPAFNLISPKSQWVGETERRTRLMLTLLKQLGGIGIIDELELQFPMDRNQSSHDSGVTQNLIGQLQSFLADTSVSGKTLLLGTSNRPNAISEAMRQRWVIIPVLMPIPQDYPEIIRSIAIELNREFDSDQHNADLLASAQRFNDAGAAPREIREALIASQAIVMGELSMEHIVFASKDIIPCGNRIASIFSDYVAIQYCRHHSFLPWWDDQSNAPDPDYPYPDYILEVMDEKRLINPEKLYRRITELQPYVNV